MGQSVFGKIQDDVDRIDGILSNPYKDIEELENNFGVSIYKFFEVLHELFNTLGLLSTSSSDDSKFEFIAAYPDETYESNNIITYDIIRRVPLKVDSKAIQGSTTYRKPRFVKENYNNITGNVEQLYTSAFNNTISLNIFSNKARTLNNMSRIVESVFYKYSGHLKKHVFEVVPIGMNSIQFTDRYDQKDRIFSRELQFNVITLEYFILELEQLKSIDLMNTN